MQLVFDAADRLVELVEERRGPVPVEEAARWLYSLRQLPAENFGTLAAGIVTRWPVRGFTPWRSLRCWGENLPKPVKVTASSRLRASVTESRKASTAFVASRFESPLLDATLSMKSAFVNGLSPSFAAGLEFAAA